MLRFCRSLVVVTGLATLAIELVGCSRGTSRRGGFFSRDDSPNYGLFDDVQGVNPPPLKNALADAVLPATCAPSGEFDVSIASGIRAKDGCFTTVVGGESAISIVYSDDMIEDAYMPMGIGFGGSINTKVQVSGSALTISFPGSTVNYTCDEAGLCIRSSVRDGTFFKKVGASLIEFYSLGSAERTEFSLYGSVYLPTAVKEYGGVNFDVVANQISIIRAANGKVTTIRNSTLNKDLTRVTYNAEGKAVRIEDAVTLRALNIIYESGLISKLESQGFKDAILTTQFTYEPVKRRLIQIASAEGGKTVYLRTQNTASVYGVDSYAGTKNIGGMRLAFCSQDANTLITRQVDTFGNLNYVKLDKTRANIQLESYMDSVVTQYTWQGVAPKFLVQKVSNSFGSTEFSYNQNNLLTTLKENGQIVKSIEYDATAVDLPTRIENQFGTVMNIGYGSFKNIGIVTSISDNGGNQTSMTRVSVTGGVKVCTTYNGSKQCSTINSKGQVVQTEALGKTSTLTYTGNGLLQQIQLPSGVQHNFTYNSREELISSSTSDSPQNPTVVEYDPSSGLTTKVSDALTQKTMGYTNAGFPISQKITSAKILNFGGATENGLFSASSYNGIMTRAKTYQALPTAPNLGCGAI